MAAEDRTIQETRCAPLLGSSDPAAAIVENRGARSPFMLICDHAGRRVPECLDSLGLPAREFDRHIAWDIGAGALASQLGARLDAWTVLQTYSRLVIDCNRAPDHPGLIVEESDGARVPGNLDLSLADRARRLAEIHAPYHAVIREELNRRAASGQPSVLISLHSFTPRMGGFRRPWQMGVLHNGASEASDRMLALLRAEPGMVVGDNEPYAMDGIDHTIPLHAIARGLPYVELETRQDLIAAPAGVERFAALLARIIPQIF